MRRSLHQLTLLFAIASGNALAAETTGVPGAPGSAGGAGRGLSVIANAASDKTHSITGGAGGAGGNGAAGGAGQHGGAAGAGGAGGDARLQVYGTPNVPGIFGPYLYAIAKGGNGGDAGLPGIGGAGASDGASAIGGAGGNASVTSVLWPGARKAEGVTIRATGGNGGKGAGRAGSAQAALALIGYDLEPSAATVEVTAGQGGDALFPGNGADGGAASSSVSGKTNGPQLTLSSSTQGGHGGVGRGAGHRGGAGAAAQATMAASVSAGNGNIKTNIWLGGGIGGAGFSGADGGDGAAMRYAATPTFSTSGKVHRTVSVFGGSAGYSSGGMAGKAGASETTLELSDTRASEIQVFVISYGGRGGFADDGGTSSAGATGLARSSINGQGTIHSNTYGYGGEGGWQNDGGHGAAGGDAFSFSDAIGQSNVNSAAGAYGGTGGGARGAGGRGGDGGKGTARASGQGDAGDVLVGASVHGGSGGMGLGGADGGNGASAHIADSVTGSSNGSLTLGNGAVGGKGGNSEGGVAGNGGNASSRLSWTESKAAKISLSTSAEGGDSGTGSNGAFAGRSGSASATSALLSTAAGAKAEANSYAQGGFVMSGTLPGEVRAGSASARTTVVSAGDGSAYASAHGGRSINSLRPVRDGSATSHAFVIAAGAARAEATGIAGSDSTSDTTAIVYAEANGGGATYARAHGWGEYVDAQAKSRALGAADNAARTTGYGLHGTLKAESISAGWNRSEAGASAIATIQGTAFAVESSANIGGAAPTLRFDPERHSAFSHTSIAPGEASGLDGDFADGQPAGTGTMGVLVRPELPGGPLSSTLTAHFQFDLSTPGQLAFAMLDTLAEQSGFVSMALSISNHGTELFARSFDSLTAVELFFDHRLLLLGAAHAGLQDLLVTAAFTLDQPGGFGFEYALGIAAVPEPHNCLMMVLGLAALLAWTRLRQMA